MGRLFPISSFMPEGQGMPYRPIRRISPPIPSLSGQKKLAKREISCRAGPICADGLTLPAIPVHPHRMAVAVHQGGDA